MAKAEVDFFHLQQDPHSRKGDNAGTSPVIEKKFLKLTSEMLFDSPENAVLTPLGSRLQGLYLREKTYLGEKMKPNLDPNDGRDTSLIRLKEINQEIEERCLELGIERGQIIPLGEQMIRIFEQREKDLQEKYPLTKRKKRNLLIPFKILLERMKKFVPDHNPHLDNQPRVVTIYSTGKNNEG